MRRSLGLALYFWIAGLSPGVAWMPGTSQPQAAAGFSVNRSDRTDVLAFYHTVYVASEGYASRISWTGSVLTGVPGTTSSTFKEDVRRRVNFFRALSGLPGDIVFNTTKNSKCQDAALMSSANRALSHTPPTNWLFYTATGAEASGKSNLALGSYGPGSIDAYMRDDGNGNHLVGHRRWILYSRAQEMGTGDLPPTGTTHLAANALWVIGNPKATGPVQFVPWPNAGYFPKTLIPARWSVSYPGANFGSATVTMTRNGVSIPVVVVSRNDNGYGENTIVWQPSDLNSAGLQDVVYAVSVTGISGVGIPTSTSYTVTAFHPDVLGQSAILTGTNVPPTTGAQYSFTPVSQADSYELRVSRGSTSPWTEGAESSPAPQVVDLTSASYSLYEGSLRRSGSRSFHLAFPSFEENTQGFEIARDVIPTTTSQLVFYDLFRFVTSDSRLSAEVSEDGGSSWTEIWGRVGNDSGYSWDWDSSFQARSLSLAAYAGKLVRIRFVFRNDGFVFLGTSANDGVFVDDISVTNATELTNTRVTTLGGTSISASFNETTAGSPLTAGATYYLRIRPNVGTRWFGDGPLLAVVPQAATLLATFRAQHTLSSTGSQDTAKPAGDGVTNLEKYAFNMIGSGTGQAAALNIPNTRVITATGNAGLPRLDTVNNRLQVTYVRRRASTNPAVTYTVEFSQTLASDSWATNPSATVSVTTLDSNFERVTVTDSAAYTRRFARVRLNVTP